MDNNSKTMRMDTRGFSKEFTPRHVHMVYNQPLVASQLPKERVESVDSLLPEDRVETLMAVERPHQRSSSSNVLTIPGIISNQSTTHLDTSLEKEEENYKSNPNTGVLLESGMNLKREAQDAPPAQQLMEKENSNRKSTSKEELQQKGTTNRMHACMETCCPCFFTRQVVHPDAS